MTLYALLFQDPKSSLSGLCLSLYTVTVHTEHPFLVLGDGSHRVGDFLVVRITGVLHALLLTWCRRLFSGVLALR